jgi:hypothetical protein
MIKVPQNLLKHLSDGEWHTSDDVFQATGITPRELRVIAGRNGDMIIGTKLGYKLVQAASLDEIRWAHRTLLSRASKILDRASKLEARAA